MTDRDSPEFHVVNLAQAKFDCSFGRGCEGICCRNGRPPVRRDEADRISANMEKFIPAMRPEARLVVEAQGFMSRRGTPDQPMMRVAAGWCVFFNKGCILHAVGEQEGDKNRYKPSPCSLFPLVRDSKGSWHVRQRGYNREAWDLFCLGPEADTSPAQMSLQSEIALAEKLSAEGR
jgi:hypothetical protein